MIEMFTGGCVLIRESVRLMEIKEGVIVVLNLEGRVQISLGELRAKGHSRKRKWHRQKEESEDIWEGWWMGSTNAVRD